MIQWFIPLPFFLHCIQLGLSPEAQLMGIIIDLYREQQPTV